MREITIFVNVEHPEIRVAELRGARLYDLEIERDNRLLGDIFWGRIENVVPGMDAAFVDIGTKRNALIYVGDLPRVGSDPPTDLAIEKLVKPGQQLIVQVARPPVGSKGARVTGKLSIPGRYTVLTTDADTVGVSRRLENPDERERLRRIAEKARPLDHGVIVRTEAEGASAPDIVFDIEFGLKQLHAIRAKTTSLADPALLHRDLGVLGRMARDRLGADIDRVVIDTAEEYHAFRNLVEVLAPAYLDRIHFHQGPEPLFSQFGIERDIARANERVVPLPHGGSLVIDEAEALTAIDVNTGKFTGKHRLADTVLKTNLEAVEEAARQLRLRNIGGVIVIDFIDMERTRDRVKVMDALNLALKGDRTRTRIVQLSPLGLVEMTRRREGDSVRRLLHSPCPYCDGDGLVHSAQTVAIEARRRVRQLIGQTNAVQVTLHPNAATAFMGSDYQSVRDLETSTATQVFINAELGFHIEKMAVQAGDTQTIEAARAALKLGQRLHLPLQVPIHRDKNITFVILSGMLVLIEPKNGETAETPVTIEQPAVIEITQTGRWFNTARLITSVDPRDD